MLFAENPGLPSFCFSFAETGRCSDGAACTCEHLTLVEVEAMIDCGLASDNLRGFSTDTQCRNAIIESLDYDGAAL